MCLDCIKPLPNALPTYGFKVFMRKGTKLFPWIFDAGKELPDSVWLDEKEWRLRDKEQITAGHSREAYNTGWHFYVTADGAHRLVNKFPGSFMPVVYKVKVKGIHTFGLQNKEKVGVCKYIKIIDRVYEK